MWSNLNDSFSALTGSINANISNLRQSIPVAFGEHEEEHVRELETKIELMRNEVVRHRDIALLYKDRWLKAEEVVKSTGGGAGYVQAKDYHETIALLGDDPESPTASQLTSPPSATTQPTTASSLPTSDPTVLSEISLNDEDETAVHLPADHHESSSSSIVQCPVSVSDLALDSAAKKIHQLEDELKKVDSDRQHWRTLAKEKSTAVEEHDQVKLQLENYAAELQKCQQNLEETIAVKTELETELQELDAQHEAALSKVIHMRDEAIAKLEEVIKDRKVMVTKEEVECQTDEESLTHHDGASDDPLSVAPTAAAASMTVHRRDSAPIIDATTGTVHLHDNAEDHRRPVAVIDSRNLLSRLRQLAAAVEVIVVDELDVEEIPLLIDRIAAKLLDQVTLAKSLEMKLELLAASNRDAELKAAHVQEEAERKLKRQDELLEEVELMNEQLTEELELLKKKSVPENAQKPVTQVQNVKSEDSAKKNQEIEALKKAVQELQLCNDQLTKELDRFKLEAAEYARSQDLMNGSVEMLQRQNQELTQVLRDTEQQLMVKQSDAAEQAQIQERKIADLERKAEEMGRGNDELQELLEQVKTEHSQILEQLKKEAAEHAQSSSVKEQKIADLKQSILELEHKLEEVQFSAQSEAASLPELREEPEGAEPGGPESQDEPEPVVSSAEVKALQVELEEVILEREQLKQSVETKETELEQLKGAHDQLDAHLKKIYEERAGVMNRLEELQRVQQEHDQLRPAYDQLVAQCQALSVEHQKALEQVATLSSDLTSRTSTSAKETEELHQLQDAVKRMSMLVQEKDQEVRQLREATAQLEAQGSETERLKTELDRLRLHLVQVEENYTAELMAAEQRSEEMAAMVERLHMEQTAGAQVEEQMRTIRTARDKARNEVSALEDKLQSYSTSIANLQGVIEQLEKDHERKLRSLEADHKLNLEHERNQTANVVRKLQSQEERLRETLEALEAASRLSETIDQKEFTINQLKRELSAKANEISSLHQKILDLESSYEGKVDKQIVKSLLISFFTTTQGTQARTEAERLIARFLDFNQQEMERAGIKIGRSAKASSNDSSFTFKFVEFLEAESNKNEQSSGRRDSTASNAPSGTAELARDLNKRMAGSQVANSRPSTINPFVPHPTQAGGGHQLGHYRTPSSASTGSSSSLELHGNPLFAGQGVPQITPVLLSSQPTTGSGTSAYNISDIVRGAVEKEDQII